ncbi:ABC transporter ATP-binding protein [Paenibacillus sp. 19GGS1-52]|uniref:ABC transporter ATP-binding protein n=1 Tax=Paenibacillus sp. 19GGS1-52 TaxID=2758563 RepID=UPI001EFA9A0E|nr:ABC transporter ATP-binding protein [Paenibacillus sp. 19GGS1-52]ULO08036.1 ABC transporter ATP-binding protein [Paenibacillus sp. 19GGS1-52]
MDAISIKNVTKSFKIFSERSATLKDRIVNRRRNNFQQFFALKDVSLDIQKGQTLGFVGRNGSGKSTLLKLLTGILYPDSGEIEVKGKVSSLLELGAGFHPDFTGRENIFMNAAILGLSKKEIKMKLDKIIAFSELKEYIDNPVRNYSSGMYMRLAFSVAIMVEPDVLLIDEVLAVGDAAFQQKCMDQLLKMKTRGVTIVFVSHDLGAMEKLCDRVVWINKGIVSSDGKPKKVIDQYLSHLAAEENNRLIQETSTVMDENKTIEETQTEIIISETEQKSDPQRWGNRFVEITNVYFTDYNNQNKLSFLSEDEMILKIRYKGNKKVENPIFGLAIHTIDHIHCYGTNTFIDYYKIKDIYANDEGEIHFKIPTLNLGSGTYLVTTAVHDEHGNQYDFHDKRFSFQVTSLSKDLGIVKIAHTWEQSV